MRLLAPCSLLVTGCLDVFRSLTPSFYRSFGRSSCASLAYLFLLLFAIEAASMLAFLAHRRADFGQLMLHSIAAQTVNAWPDGLVITLTPSSGLPSAANGDLRLSVNKPLPLTVDAPEWTSAFMRILASFVLHSFDDAADVEHVLQRLLPKPQFLFVGAGGGEAISRLLPPPQLAFTDRTVHFFGEPMVSVHLFAPLADAVCEPTESGWRCEKRHIAELLAPLVTLGQTLQDTGHPWTVFGLPPLTFMVSYCLLSVLFIFAYAYSCAAHVLGLLILQPTLRAILCAMDEADRWPLHKMLAVSVYASTPLLLASSVMRAVSRRHAPSPLAFFVLHLVLSLAAIVLSRVHVERPAQWRREAPPQAASATEPAHAAAPAAAVLTDAPATVARAEALEASRASAAPALSPSSTAPAAEAVEPSAFPSTPAPSGPWSRPASAGPAGATAFEPRPSSQTRGASPAGPCPSQAAGMACTEQQHAQLPMPPPGALAGSAQPQEQPLHAYGGLIAEVPLSEYAELQVAWMVSVMSIPPAAMASLHARQHAYLYAQYHYFASLQAGIAGSCCRSNVGSSRSNAAT